MIGPGDLDEYFRMIDELRKKAGNGDQASILSEMDAIFKDQIALNKRVLKLQLRLMGEKL